MRTRNRLAVLLALAAIPMVARPAHAESFFDFVFFGSQVNFFGRFSAIPASAGSYLITGVRGTAQYGNATGPIFAVVPPGSFQGNDNLLYTSGDHFDYAGVSFVAGLGSGGLVNLSYDAGQYGGRPGYYAIIDVPYPEAPRYQITTAVVTEVPVPTTTPEPSTWAFAGVGLLGVGGITLRRRYATV